MLSETVVYTTLFIIGVCEAPELALVSAVLVLLGRATQQYHVLAEMLKTQAKLEESIARLQEYSSALEAELSSTSAENRTLTEKNKEMQEARTISETSICELQKRLSRVEKELESSVAEKRSLEETNAQMHEANTQSETTITELQKKLSTIEVDLASTRLWHRASVKELTRIDATREALDQDLAQAKATAAALLKELKEKRREVKDWRGYYTSPNHGQTIQRNGTTPTSMAGIIAERDRTIKQLEARLSQLEAHNEEATQARATASALREELEAKKKEATDWKGLFLHSSTSPNLRQAIKRGDTASVSLAGIIADKDHIIKQLRDRFSECYAHLTKALNRGGTSL